MDNPLSNPTIGRIAATAVEAVQDTAANPNNPLSQTAVQVSKGEIAQNVANAIQASPELQHALSTEPWYQSRANWSAILGAVTALSSVQYLFTKFTGIEWTGIPAADMEAYSAILALVCGTAGGYLARRARTATRPLGS